MDTDKIAFSTIDEYISQFPPEVREKLQQMRAVIKEAAPEAAERISYQMPAFYLNGNLVYFAAFKHHIGFYPAPRGIEAFQEELSQYKGAKGSVQFPLDKPLPLELVSRIVKFRAAENTKKPEHPAKRERYPMPDFIKNALADNNLTESYESRPPYQRNDYIGWITRAKLAETRQKRLKQMLDELRQGNIYMKMSYNPKDVK